MAKTTPAPAPAPALAAAPASQPAAPQSELLRQLLALSPEERQAVGQVLGFAPAPAPAGQDVSTHSGRAYLRMTEATHWKEGLDAEQDHIAARKTHSGHWNIAMATGILERTGYSKWQEEWKKKTGGYPVNRQEWPLDMIDGQLINMMDGSVCPRNDIKGNK